MVMSPPTDKTGFPGHMPSFVEVVQAKHASPFLERARVPPAFGKLVILKFQEQRHNL